MNWLIVLAKRQLEQSWHQMTFGLWILSFAMLWKYECHLCLVWSSWKNTSCEQYRLCFPIFFFLSDKTVTSGITRFVFTKLFYFLYTELPSCKQAALGAIQWWLCLLRPDAVLMQSKLHYCCRASARQHTILDVIRSSCFFVSSPRPSYI